MLSITHRFAGFGLFSRLSPSQLGRKNFLVSITVKMKFFDLTVVKTPSLERNSFLQDLPCLNLSATSGVLFGSMFVMEIERVHGNRTCTIQLCGQSSSLAGSSAMSLTPFEQRLLQWLYTEHKTGERTKPAFPPQRAKYCTLQKQSSKVVGVALEKLSPLVASVWLHSFPLSYCPESEYLLNYQCIKFLLSV